ncbi:short-chain fatty acyl-CoA regulator family protein [Streptomyces aureoversilis]|uniref:Short-chain fatty acyl-CoA regulator family protein n=1 Tax=Streptomyces aureoversilis TaxID=67277 RepID=A0ABW0A342_9ACTN
MACLPRPQPREPSPPRSPSAFTCSEVRQAHRLFHPDRLDLGRTAIVTPIGMGYRVCGRFECPQRTRRRLAAHCGSDPITSTLMRCAVV